MPGITVRSGGIENNLKRYWWKRFIQESVYNVGIDSGILMNPEVWVASGHIANFTDPLTDCKSCGVRHRADKLIDEATNGEVNADGWTNEQLYDYIKSHKIACPACGGTEFTPVRQFNMMFKTNQGVIEDAKNTIYLRPETAQGIFVNFKNVQRTSRKKVPFGIGQIGKSFRNEITPGNFIFRTRELNRWNSNFSANQEPTRNGSIIGINFAWTFERIGSSFRTGQNQNTVRKNCRIIQSHNGYRICFLFGWGELWGVPTVPITICVHQEHSKEKLEYLDPETNEKYLPM